MDISAAASRSAIGIRRSVERLNDAAARLAARTSEQPVDGMAELLTARHVAQANISAFHAAASFDRTMMDILA